MRDYIQAIVDLEEKVAALEEEVTKLRTHYHVKKGPSPWTSNCIYKKDKEETDGWENGDSSSSSEATGKF